MQDNDLLPGLFKALSQNQIAIAAAIEELTYWVEQRGSVETAISVREALKTLDNNLEFITLSISLIAENN